MVYLGICIWTGVFCIWGCVFADGVGVFGVRDPGRNIIWGGSNWPWLKTKNTPFYASLAWKSELDFEF